MIQNMFTHKRDYIVFKLSKIICTPAVIFCNNPNSKPISSAENV